LYTSTSYTISSGVIAGTSYKFKVRAYNKWGYGSFSTPDLTILAA
jgi:hypothetical protein